MAYKLIYTKKAEKYLDNLNQETRKRILLKLDEYIKLENPLEKAKLLQGISEKIYRFRIGDYRAVIRPDPKTNNLVILVVLKIAHRKDIYKK